MIKNKKKILSKIIQTKAGSIALTCLVGSAILTLSTSTTIYFLYHKLRELQKDLTFKISMV